MQGALVAAIMLALTGVCAWIAFGSVDRASIYTSHDGIFVFWYWWR